MKKLFDFSIPSHPLINKADKEKREFIRRIADPIVPQNAIKSNYFGFEIISNNFGKPKNIHKISKAVADAFSEKMINLDLSNYLNCLLYVEDTWDYVVFSKILIKKNEASRIFVKVFGK
ncbi:MAG: hypothetical protein ABEK36_01540 [Candidatus Aenigmatarchaeota archaeon]